MYFHNCGKTQYSCGDSCSIHLGDGCCAALVERAKPDTCIYPVSHLLKVVHGESNMARFDWLKVPLIYHYAGDEKETQSLSTHKYTEKYSLFNHISYNIPT